MPSAATRGGFHGRAVRRVPGNRQRQRSVLLFPGFLSGSETLGQVRHHAPQFVHFGTPFTVTHRRRPSHATRLKPHSMAGYVA